MPRKLHVVGSVCQYSLSSDCIVTMCSILICFAAAVNVSAPLTTIYMSRAVSHISAKNVLCLPSPHTSGFMWLLAIGPGLPDILMCYSSVDIMTVPFVLPSVLVIPSLVSSVSFHSLSVHMLYRLNKLHLQSMRSGLCTIVLPNLSMPSFHLCC